jgi:hypothetical protein
VGRLEPAAMQRALRIMDAEIKVAGVNVTPPCDEHGVAR